MTPEDYSPELAWRLSKAEVYEVYNQINLSDGPFISFIGKYSLSVLFFSPYSLDIKHQIMEHFHQNNLHV